MPVNKRSKFRGSRTCGGGTHKNRRGAGNRGGRGRAGHRDHRFSYFLLYDEVHNGKNGFNSPTSVVVPAIGIGRIDQMAESLLSTGAATREGDLIAVDAAAMGIEKILGTGRVTRKLKVSAKAFSAQAKEKIESLGGQAILT